MSDAISLSCCGITELADIRYDDSPEESLMEVDPSDQGLVVFSDADSYYYKRCHYGKGKALAKLIGKAKLGGVIAIPATLNPNTDNHVKAWVWRVNKRALRTWQNKYRKAHPRVYGEDGNEDPYFNPWRWTNAQNRTKSTRTASNQ